MEPRFTGHRFTEKSWIVGKPWIVGEPGFVKESQESPDLRDKNLLQTDTYGFEMGGQRLKISLIGEQPHPLSPL